MKTIKLNITDDIDFGPILELVETIDGVETTRTLTDDEKAELVVGGGGVLYSTLASVNDLLTAERAKVSALEAQAIVDHDAHVAAHTSGIETIRVERQAEIDALNTQLEEALNGPKPVNTGGVTKLTIKRKLDALGPDKWPKLKAAIATFPEDVQDEWHLAQEILSDDPTFVANADAFKALLKLTDEQFIALLTP